MYEKTNPLGYGNLTQKHIMWTLYFLKDSLLRLTAAKFFRVSEKTFDNMFGIVLC